MSRTLPKQFNPLITIEVAPTYDELLARRRLGQTNLSVKPAQIGTSNATKPENLGVFEYAHLRAPLPKDLEGSEIFPSHSPQQQPESYFLMRRSKDGFVSATGMFKIAFPWAKAEEERTEREYLKAREFTSEEEVAGNVWISPTFALELSKEYQMYDWVRALLDPTDIVQSSSAKKHITPPPKFEIPSDEPPVSQRNRRGRSASPSKKSPRKPRSTRITKDVTSTPSTTAANASLQSALDTASGLAAEAIPELRAVDGEAEATLSGSPGKKTKARKSARSATAEPEEETKEETKEEKKEKKKAEKKEKKKQEIQEQDETVEVSVADDATDAVKPTHTTVSLDMPISLPEVPSAAETEEMIAQAKEMVEEATKAQAESTSVKTTSKRKAEDDEDEETSAEASQRAKKAKVLENRLKQERVRNRSIFGVSVAFALASFYAPYPCSPDTNFPPLPPSTALRQPSK
ncbi:unnamed protein product [Penicillium nalgiovense]|uniref:Cell pattern formation-associated protein stuA n=1 Tax=Penicillium nalgiovense TaxID=60175 RepID=A0A9W4HZN6_PENNA|nr:unnamed protein product [Penicillium nalgiovense]CAG7947740.1 unnamed protein product [Penicillium nalgiovense]CAG7964858.1 unnamed protein product [Penicillium nalgiovense]CAG7977640.1 unnamed protein product [Penicillium nalgiovense]CAG8003894.1 unnamed protein product [Penicillium nalgiovense]